MAVLWLHVENFYIGVIISLDVEEFATTILTDVDHDGTGSLPPAILHQWAHLSPSAELLEFGFDEVYVHVVMDTGGSGQVRGNCSQVGVQLECVSVTHVFKKFWPLEKLI